MQNFEVIIDLNLLKICLIHAYELKNTIYLSDHTDTSL